MTIINILEPDPPASSEVQTERLGICHSCEKYNSSEDRCSECSCLIERRVYYVEMFCPIGKW